MPDVGRGFRKVTEVGSKGQTDGKGALGAAEMGHVDREDRGLTRKRAGPASASASLAVLLCPFLADI